MKPAIKISREIHKSKNLVDWEKHINSGFGFICTQISDGVFHITGRPDARYRRICDVLDEDVKLILRDGVRYTFSIGFNSSDFYAMIQVTNAITGDNMYYNTMRSDPTFVTNFEVDVYRFAIRNGETPKDVDLVIYPQLEEGATPTPFEPYKNNYLPRHLLNRRSVIFE